MIDLKDLIKNPEKYKENLRKRQWQDTSLVDEIVSLKKELNQLIKETEAIRAFINKVSGTKPTSQTIEEVKKKKKVLKKLENQIKEKEKILNQKLHLLPNLISPEVPYGKDEHDNVVIKTWGEIPKFDFEIKDHVELGKEYDLIDIERAGKVSGSRFYYLKNEAVLLEFALINFVYDLLRPYGFIPVIPPVFIKEKYYQGMGRISGKDREERYYLPQDDLFLVGSA